MSQSFSSLYKILQAYCDYRCLCIKFRNFRWRDSHCDTGIGAQIFSPFFHPQQASCLNPSQAYIKWVVAKFSFTTTHFQNHVWMLYLSHKYQWLMEQRQTMDPIYVIDEVIDGMMNGNKDMAVVYSGDAATILSENEDMGFFMPTEGTNMWRAKLLILGINSKSNSCNAFSLINRSII